MGLTRTVESCRPIVPGELKPGTAVVVWAEGPTGERDWGPARLLMGTSWWEDLVFEVLAVCLPLVLLRVLPGKRTVQVDLRRYELRAIGKRYREALDESEELAL